MNKIRKILLKVFKIQDNDVLVLERDSALSIKNTLGTENNLLKAKIIHLESELSKIQNRPHVPINLGDPIPDDQEKRKMYVAMAASAHKDTYGPKIMSIINMMREEFEKVNRDTFGYSQEIYDHYLKGAINSLWLMYEWGESMINEQVANQNPVEMSEEDLEELAEKVI